MAYIKGWESLLIHTQGIVSKKERIDASRWRQAHTQTHYVRDGNPIIVPENTFVQITATATKGSIGKLVDIDFDESRHSGHIETWSGTYILEFEGRPRPSRIASYHANILDVRHAQTKYIRNTKKKVVQDVELTNKYGQILSTGDWITGVGAGKRLYYGKVVRYTHANIWVTVDTTGAQKPKTHRINDPAQWMAMPFADDDFHEKHIEFLVLTGWKGNQ